MCDTVLESEVSIIGTLDGFGNFQWAGNPQQASAEAHRIVAALCKSYTPLQTAALSSIPISVSSPQNPRQPNTTE